MFLGPGSQGSLASETNTSNLEEVEAWDFQVCIPSILASVRAGAITRLSASVASFDVLDGNILACITFATWVRNVFLAAGTTVVHEGRKNVVVILSKESYHAVDVVIAFERAIRYWNT